MRRLSTVTRWVITGRNVEQLTKAYEGCGDNALALQLDVSNEEQAAAAVNAAVAYFGRIPASASSDYSRKLVLRDRRPVQHQRVWPLQCDPGGHVMRKQRSGHILNVRSIGGSVGFAGSTVYCATKYAVEGFSESLALEVADFGINVSIVAPGFVRTDFLDSSSVRYGDKTPKSPQISAPPTTATATNKPAIPRNWPARL